jgi:hypothetical protein
MSKRDYERGIYIKGAFGRRDYMYIYEVAPWAYDKDNDWLKVSIKDSIALDISDDWTRELGQVDLAKILGAVPSATNPLPSRLTTGTAYYDARDRSWNLGDSDVPDLKDRPARQLGYVYGHLDQVLRQKATTFDLLTYDDAVNDLLAAGLPTSLDTGALRVREQNWPASYPVTGSVSVSNFPADYPDSTVAARLPTALDAGALKIKEQSPLSGFATSAKQDTMITALQIIDDMDIKKIGGTALTGRDLSSDLKALTDDLTGPDNDKSFGCLSTITSVATGGFNDFMLVNPNASGKTAHVTYVDFWVEVQGLTGGYISVQVCPAPTTSANGTAETEQSRKCGSATNAACILYYAPTVSAYGNIGFLSSVSAFGTIAHFIMGGWADKPLFSLPANSKLLFRCGNVTGATGHMRFNIWWTEI